MRDKVVPPPDLVGSPSRGETGIDDIDGDVGWKDCPVASGETDSCPSGGDTVLLTLLEWASCDGEEVTYPSSEGYIGERNIF